jgi:hypothetical protein
LGHIYLFLGLGAFALVAFSVSLYKTVARRYRLPYTVDPALFSPAQLAFLAVLERAVGRDYRVYGQIRAAYAIGVRRRLDRRTRRRAWERLGEHRFDFLICRATTGAILCAVNLAPKSRLRRGVPRDMLDRICAAAGLPFVRFRESEVYSATEIAERVFAAVRSAGKTLREPEPAQPQTPDDLSDDLDELGETFVAEDRGSVRERRVVQSSRPVAARPKLAPAPQPAEPARLEPKIAGTGDIDLGPSFRIDGELDEEERPVRRVLG